jgi:hypothetical protein
MWPQENFGEDLQASEATSIRACRAGLSALPLVPNAELWSRQRSSKSRSRAFNKLQAGRFPLNACR